MARPFIQTSFHSGEWAPALNARVDLAKYHSAAELLENFFVDYRGGASTRAGTQYVIQALGSGVIRLIPFQISTSNGYILEFGNNYIRFINNGAPVLEAAKAITGITQANPAVVTSAGHGYANGDWVFITGVGGMTQINGRYYIVAGVTANTFQLRTLDSVALNSTAYGAYTAGGTVARIYTIGTTYTSGELAQIKFTQDVDQMTICHPSHAPATLTFVTATNWVLANITFAADIVAPAAPTITTTLAAGAVNYAYVVTAVSATGDESPPSPAGVLANVQDIRTVAGTIQIAWVAVAGAAFYNVYRASLNYGAPVPAGAAFGFIGFSTGVALIDDNIGPNFSQTPPVAENPFAAGQNPAVPGFFQQRLVLANTPAGPQTFYLSQPGTPFNFNVTNPIQPDNAISGSLRAGQLNVIKSVVAIQSGMLTLTDRAVWLITGGSNVDGITVSPSNIAANPHSYNGASDVPPIVANFDILFVQAKGSVVRDLTYDIYANVFRGTDISVLSSHLFYGFTIKEWAWAEEPFKLIWAVRSDGVALTLTFLKEQDLIGWTHSISPGGTFMSVATVSENTATAGLVDAVYFAITRIVGGHTFIYIERLAERIFPTGAQDAWCVDSGLSYSGAPASSFTGAEHLAGLSVTGLADGAFIAPFVMPSNGFFTLPTPASKVILGIFFQAKLKTLALDVTDPEGTVQSRQKTIPQVTVRVKDALNLNIGKSFTSLVPMKDTVLGNVGSMSNELVTNLVTCDVRTVLDPSWTVPGQYCIATSEPYPATILGVIPQATIGDTPSGGAKR